MEAAFWKTLLYFLTCLTFTCSTVVADHEHSRDVFQLNKDGKGESVLLIHTGIIPMSYMKYSAWNHSIVVTIGGMKFWLYRGVGLFQGFVLSTFLNGDAIRTN